MDENEVKTRNEMKVEPSSTGGGGPKHDSVYSEAKVDSVTPKVAQPTLQRKRKKKSKIKESNPRTVNSGRPQRTIKPVDRLNIATVKGPSYAHVIRG